MNAFKPISVQILAALTFLWICSCNYTHTYTPDFNGKKATVLDSINGKYAFENIQIQGKTISGTGGTNSTLIIRFINGKNLPTDTSKIVALAQQLAHQVKSIVKNPKAIENFNVYFDTKTVNGDSTTTQSIEMAFKAENI